MSNASRPSVPWGGTSLVNEQLKELYDGGGVGDSLCRDSLAVADLDRQIPGRGVERGEGSLIGHIVTDIERCL